jgi:hypothetical protein
LKGEIKLESERTAVDEEAENTKSHLHVLSWDDQPRITAKSHLHVLSWDYSQIPPTCTGPEIIGQE